MLIKKKGRPATQCLKCRELRLVRQLHRKCDCDTNDEKALFSELTGIPVKEVDKQWINETGVPKKRKKKDSLRLLAPKQDMANQLQTILDTLDFCSPTYSTEPLYNQTLTEPFLDIHYSTPQSCCKGIEKKEQDIPRASKKSCCPPSSKPSGGCCPNTAPASCLGPPAKNQQGETIRLVTCRCGDDCACIGCDAHPSRAMKEGKKDVYVGFNEPRDFPWPSKNDDSRESLCGCAKQSKNCSDCLLKLYYPNYV